MPPLIHCFLLELKGPTTEEEDSTPWANLRSHWQHPRKVYTIYRKSALFLEIIENRHSDPAKLKETAENVQRLSPDKLKKRQMELKELVERLKMPSDAQLMQIAIDDLNNSSLPSEYHHRALQELLILVEQIDNANVSLCYMDLIGLCREISFKVGQLDGSLISHSHLLYARYYYLLQQKYLAIRLPIISVPIFEAMLSLKVNLGKFALILVDLHKLGGLSVIIRELNNPDPEIRTTSAWILGKACQNNPVVQKQVLELGGLAKLMNMVKSSFLEEARKALYAVSALIRNNLDGQQLFYAETGDLMLQDILRNSSIDIRLRRKSVSLVADLAECRLQTRNIAELPFFSNRFFLRSVVDLTASTDLDLQEKRTKDLEVNINMSVLVAGNFYLSDVLIQKYNSALHSQALVAIKNLLQLKTTEALVFKDFCGLDGALHRMRQQLQQLMAEEYLRDYALDVESLRREVELIFHGKLEKDAMSLRAFESIYMIYAFLGIDLNQAAMLPRLCVGRAAVLPRLRVGHAAMRACQAVTLPRSCAGLAAMLSRPRHAMLLC
ncbi:hypothetical protein TEA_013112 [Camellia sinensis var. sinensis]|uniref:Nucleotide exchange factor Fes1 domain-containing protein n=1 Tax=Camellia sinensis var. sinensis TaxID=542762 RepID=A0A4S4D9P9_CAMSN|nr:hypothetical protein TEA_013112 [Camellia sinensis var. sinensis]